jgi:hypothetical protein
VRPRDVPGIVLLVATVATVGSAFESTTGCDDGWGWSSQFPVYVIPAAIALAGAIYFFLTARFVRPPIAGGLAVTTLLGGGFGIYFLAMLDAIAACPPQTGPVTRRSARGPRPSRLVNVGREENVLSDQARLKSCEVDRTRKTCQQPQALT